MEQVLTLVTATIAPERAHEVKSGFSAAVRAGRPERHQMTLIRDSAGRWGVLTVWRSRADLDGYLASVDEPFAWRLLHQAGGSPQAEVFDVVADSHAPWWP